MRKSKHKWFRGAMAGLLMLSGLACRAQDFPNALVVHQSDGNEAVFPATGIDRVGFADEGDGNWQLYVRRNDGTEETYSEADFDYADFMFVDAATGQRAVDLGLTVLWAACNVGAERPEEYGDLFAWGETAPKEDYSEENYKYYVNGSYEEIGYNISGTRYDAATAQWGGKWRMPTLSEVRELLACDWERATLNGVNGYRVTGCNGNSIFLPAAGYQPGTERQDAGEWQGYYWASTLNRSMPSSAYTLNFRGYDDVWTASRAYGFSIRAVR